MRRLQRRVDSTRKVAVLGARQVGAVIGRVGVLWRVLMIVPKILWVTNYGKLMGTGMILEIMIVEIMVLEIMILELFLATETEVLEITTGTGETEIAIGTGTTTEIGMIHNAIAVDTIETTGVLATGERTTDVRLMTEGTIPTTGNIDKNFKIL